jgi:type IV secretory pathway VirB10-like protein
MGDTEGTPKADAPETEATPATTPDAAPQPTKTDVPPEVAAALKKANKEAETLRLKLKDIEDRDKSETQRATEEASQAKADAAQARTDFLRLKVGMAKGLPASLAERLKGDNEEEMTADADALLVALKPKGNGAGSFDAGTRQTAPASPDMNSQLRRMAGRA